MNNDYPILRYGDILLVKAEAEARMAGNWSAPEALRLVNQLRARAGVSAYTSLTEDEFLAERGREMFMEASRRQDYIRFGRWGNEWWEKPKSAEFRDCSGCPFCCLDCNADRLEAEKLEHIASRCRRVYSLPQACLGS